MLKKHYFQLKIGQKPKVVHSSICLQCHSNFVMYFSKDFSNHYQKVLGTQSMPWNPSVRRYQSPYGLHPNTISVIISPIVHSKGLAGKFQYLSQPCQYYFIFKDAYWCRLDQQCQLFNALQLFSSDITYLENSAFLSDS